MLGPEEYKRFSKQIALTEIGLAGQQLLKQSKVLVVGAGGLGCPALQYLTAAGVGTIGIMDGDVVDLSNLHRQVLYGDSVVGKKKVAAAANALQFMSPDTNLLLFDEYLTKANAEKIIGEFDVVIDATDNLETRYLLDDMCFHLHKPWIFAGVYKHEGQLSVFNYPAGRGVRYADVYPVNENKATPDDCNIAGVLGTLPGVLGTLQANECIKLITGKAEVLSGKMFVMNLLTMQTTMFYLPHSTNA